MKKIAVCVFAFLTAFVVSATAFAEANIEELEGLGFEGIGSEEEYVTRAEAARYALLLTGLTKEDTELRSLPDTELFDDVAPDNENAKIIYGAKESGIIEGHGDGTFAPEEYVTCEQFVKMVICALGYAPAARNTGGYPSGFMFNAERLGITEGLSSAGSDAITREQAAEIINNSLDINIMELSSVSPGELGGTTYTINEELTPRVMIGK